MTAWPERVDQIENDCASGDFWPLVMAPSCVRLSLPGTALAPRNAITVQIGHSFIDEHRLHA